MGNERKHNKGEKDTIEISGRTYPYIDKTTGCPRPKEHRKAAEVAVMLMSEYHVNSTYRACVLSGEEHWATVISDMGASGQPGDGMGNENIHHVEINTRKRN